MTAKKVSQSLQDLLAPLIDELTAAEAQGETVDVDEMAGRHPEYRDEILSALRLIQSLDRLDDGNARSEEDKNDPKLKQIGDFQLIRELGRGGMGIVYEAEQLTVERRVAVKLLPFAALADPTRLQRFKNEVRAAGALHHPHIVPVFAVGVERGVHYFAMQLINGPSCETLLTNLRKGPSPQQDNPADPSSTRELPVRTSESGKDTVPDIQAEISTVRTTDRQKYLRTVATWGVQAAEALAFAHENGVLHRDIKPGNLLLDERGQVWIADFGLARIEQDPSVTMTGDILGTVRYMAPEQATPDRVLVDHRADIYSLGATLYELLTLRPMWDGKNRDELLHQIATITPTSIRQLEARVPADLAIIIDKAIAKDREDRFASAQEFADDLQRFLNGEAIKTHPPTLPQRLRTWGRRHPRTVTSLIVGSLAIGLLLGWLIQGQRNVISSIQNHQETAQLFLDSGNHEDAGQQIARADVILNKSLWVPRDLAQSVRALEAAVAARKRAYATLAAFGRAYDKITGNMDFSTDEELPELRRECLTAVGMYGLPANGLDTQSDFLLLPPAEQSVIKQQTIELLFIAAVSGMGAAQASEDRRTDYCDNAIEIFSGIEAQTRPFRATRLWSALAHEMLGRQVEVEAFRAEVDDLPSETPFELFALGEFYYSQRDYEAAAKEFESALQLQPDSFLALMAYAKTLRLFGNENSNPGSPQFVASNAKHRQIEALCTGALAVHPEAVSAYLTRAIARRSQGRWQDTSRKMELAYQDLEVAESLAPNKFKLLIERTFFSAITGEKEKCLATFRRLEAMWPHGRSDLDFWHAHWLIMLRHGDQESNLRHALRLLSQALDNMPSRLVPAIGTWSIARHDRPVETRTRILLRRGWLHRQLGDEAAARRDFRQVVNTPARWENQKFLIGLAYLLLGEKNNATNVFDELELGDVSIGDDMAFLQRSIFDGQVEFVLDMLTKLPPSLIHDSLLGFNWAIELHNHAQELKNKGKAREAIPYLETSIRLAPMSANPYFQLGQCYFQMGDYKQAVPWLTKAIELDPDGVANGQRALTYVHLDDLEAAIADLDQLLATQKHSLWGVRAVCQLTLGRVDDYEATIQGDFSDGIDNCPTWWFTLAPTTWNGMSNVVEIAQERVNGSREVKSPVTSNLSELRKELGTALYRIGEFEKAKRELTVALNPIDGEAPMQLEERILAASFLSMAESKLGNAPAAEEWLNQAKDWAAEKPEQGWRELRIDLAISEAASTLRHEKSSLEAR